MATFVWAAAANGNWNVGGNWKVGGVAQASPPTAADDVLFGSGTGATNFNVSLNSGSVCRSVNCTGYTGNMNFGGAANISVGDGSGGAFILASGMTVSGQAFSTQTFVSTSNNGGTGWQFKTFGLAMGNITFNGAGGKWVIQDALTVGATGGGTLTLTAGTLDTNSQTITAGIVSSNNSNTRTLELGTSAITLNFAGNAWTFQTLTGLTGTLSSSTITLSGDSAVFLHGNTNATGSKAFGTVAFTGSGAATMTLGASCTFVNLTRTGTANREDSLSLNTNITVSGTFTVNSNSSINRVNIGSSVRGTARTITAAAFVATNIVDFRDITGAGAATWTAAASGADFLGDALGNSGITFATPATQTWRGGAWLNGSYLRSTNTASSFATAPDTAALSITGDIDIRVRVALDDWTPSAINELITKSTPTSNQRSWQFYVDTTGVLTLAWSVAGSSFVTAASTVAPTVTDGATLWVRATLDVNNGASGYTAKFYTATGSLTAPTASDFTQLGSDVVGGATTSIFDSTTPVAIGIINTDVAGGTLGATGNLYRTQIYNGIDGTLVFDANLAAQAADTKTFSESSSNAATVTVNQVGGNWSDVTKWTSRVPLPQDNVVISSAFSSTQTITTDMARLGKDVDWTGSTGTTLRMASASNTTSSLHGSFILASGMGVTVASGSVWALNGRGSHTLSTQNISIGEAMQINAVTGTYTLASDYTHATNTFTVGSGTLDTAGYTWTHSAQILISAGATLTTGSSTFNFTGTNALTFVSVSATANINASSATFVIVNASANTRTFTGGGKTYGTLTYTVAGSTGILVITGANTFGTINFSDVTNARTLQFTAATTTTITNSFNVNGTSGKLMSIQSVTAATHTLSKPSGVVSSDYLNITNSIATGGASWYAGANSTNGGGNTGWFFTPPSNSQFFYFM